MPKWIAGRFPAYVGSHLGLAAPGHLVAAVAGVILLGETVMAIMLAGMVLIGAGNASVNQQRQPK